MAPNTIETYDGTEVDVDVIEPLAGGGARVEIDEEDGPRWRLDVTSTGKLAEVVTTWNSDDELADVEIPDWIGDVLSRLARV